MLFKKSRSLKDKVFGTKIEFVDFGERDALGQIDVEAKAKEQDLIDNFGAPQVSVGKEFVGHVKLVDGKVTLVEQTDADAICITYILSEKILDVTTGFTASIGVDAKKETAIEAKLTAEQVAEAKCLVFEEVVAKRLLATIDSLKAKFTAFESEALEEIAIPVPTAPEHKH